MSVNLAAPVNRLGYGHVGLNLALALERAGAAPALWPIGAPEADARHHDSIRAMLARARHYDPDAPSLRLWHDFDLAQHVGRGVHAAMTIFELDRFRPASLHQLRCQDLVVVNSEWARGVLLGSGLPESRVRVAPLGVDREVFRDSPMPEGPTTFFNCGKWELRKGHDLLIRAFEKAFSPGQDVRLVMNCHNPCLGGEDGRRYNAQWASLYMNSPMAERIEVLPRRLETQNDVAALMARCHCGVFPARAEGWNLDALECLSSGRHLVITDCAAHREYAEAGNATLLPVGAPEPAHDGVWFRADDPAWEGRPGRWSSLTNDTLDALVEAMRAVHLRRQAGLLGVNRAGIDTAESFPWSRCAAAVLEALGSP